MAYFPSMAKILTILAAITAVAVIGAWALLGANRGWTKTSVGIQKIDPVTEIAFTEYESRFVPGVDFLAVGLGGAIGLGVIALVISKIKSTKKP